MDRRDIDAEKEFLTKFKKDKEIITRAFIMFYGEINKEYIVKIMEDLNVFWYDENPLDDEKNLANHLITYLPQNVVEEILMKRNSEVFLQSGYIEEFNILCFPQKYNLTHIIHEINHKVSSHIVSLKPYNSVSGISLIIETGNGVIEYNNDLNEGINELMTLDIIKILKELKNNINPTASWQENLFPIIISFYEKFKEQLKALYISGDLNLFVNQIGKEQFEEYSQFIFTKGFKIKRKLNRGEQLMLSDTDIDTADKIVQSMNPKNNGLSK